MYSFFKPVSESCSGELRHNQNDRNFFPPLPLVIEYSFYAQKNRINVQITKTSGPSLNFSYISSYHEIPCKTSYFVTSQKFKCEYLSIDNCKSNKILSKCLYH